MAKGDYGAGAQLEPIRIEIEVDENLRLSHVGVGYHVRLPSGKVHDSGFTWHSPRGNYAHGQNEYVDKLQEVVDEVLRLAAEWEGVEFP